MINYLIAESKTGKLKCLMSDESMKKDFPGHFLTREVFAYIITTMGLSHILVLHP